MKALKKPLSLLMALLMCFGVFAGTGITAYAAGERMTAYLVDLPRANESSGLGKPGTALYGWLVSFCFKQNLRTRPRQFQRARFVLY